MKKVMTAPLALIKFDGVIVGKMRNIRLTESISRGTVRGIGNLAADEVPPLTWDGTLTCGMYLIDFSKAMNFIENANPDNPNGSPVLLRKGVSAEEFFDDLLLQEDGVTVDIMRKVKQSQDGATGIIQKELEIFASIRGAFITREGADISEGQIGGRDADFTYINPVIYT